MLTGIYWNETYQRHQQFAEYLAKAGYKVDFVEHIVSSKFNFNVLIKRLLYRGNTANSKENSRDKNIKCISSKFVFPGSGVFKLYNKWAAKKLLIDLEDTYDIVINYLPLYTTRYIIEKVRYKKLIYDCVRNFEGWGRYYGDLIDEEAKLIKIADKIFTDSYFLTDNMAVKAPEKVVQFLPIANNKWLAGCIHKKTPEQIKDIAYFGTFSYHIDVAILSLLASNRFKIHIWGELAEHPNFEYIYHGYENDLTKLATDIIDNTDAIIIPYQGVMDGVIPAKMIQCLSSGLPVFISSFYDSNKLREYQYVYKNGEQLLNMLSSYSPVEYKQKQEKINQYIKCLTEGDQYHKFISEIES